MKWVLYIAALFLITQMIHPCLGGGNCHGEKTAHQQEKDSGTACQCVCCTSIVFLLDIEPADSDPILFSQKAQQIVDLYSYEFRSPIWQPPRFS